MTREMKTTSVFSAPETRTSFGEGDVRVFGAENTDVADPPRRPPTTSVFSGRKTQTSTTSVFSVFENTDVDGEYTLRAPRSRVRDLLALTHMTSVFSVPETRTSPAWRRRCGRGRKRRLCFLHRKNRRHFTYTRNAGDVCVFVHENADVNVCAFCRKVKKHRRRRNNAVGDVCAF